MKKWPLLQVNFPNDYEISVQYTCAVDVNSQLLRFWEWLITASATISLIEWTEHAVAVSNQQIFGWGNQEIRNKETSGQYQKTGYYEKPGQIDLIQIDSSFKRPELNFHL